MAKINPKDRRYTKEHEWALDNGDGTITMGITDHAQELLTDIVFVELPAMGKRLRQMDVLAVVESVKSVSDVYAPVGGEVTGVNKKLEESPELINIDPYGRGWIAKIRMDEPSELAALMEAEEYEAFIVVAE